MSVALLRRTNSLHVRDTGLRRGPPCSQRLSRPVGLASNQWVACSIYRPSANDLTSVLPNGLGLALELAVHLTFT